MTHMLVRTVTRPSTIAALAASLLLVGIKVLFERYPGEFPARGQAEAFTWLLVGGVILIGLLARVHVDVCATIHGSTRVAGPRGRRRNLLNVRFLRNKHAPF